MDSSTTTTQGASPTDRLKRPGFGLPLNYTPRVEKGDGRDLFRNALDGKYLTDGIAQLPLTPLREFTMMRVMDHLTDKPAWHVKVFDETITSKWKAEGLAEDHDDDRDMTEKMFDWCIAELQYKAKIYEKAGTVTVYNGDVVKSDIAIPNTLKEALNEAVAPLEQVPARDKDWHPESDDQVLDLVHPSLFPLIYGLSRILPDSVVGLNDCVGRSGEGVIIPVPPDIETDGQPTNRWHRKTFTTPFSQYFQWLPCEVDISGGNGHVKITSYINNLHPKEHPNLYTVLEEIISRTIPLWNATLTPLKDQSSVYQRIKYTECEYDPDPESWDETEILQQGDNEDEHDYNDRLRDWYEEIRVVIQPEPGPFEPPPINDDPAKSVDIWRDYANQGLQVIVKLSNIHLTPEQPEYEGGSWHVEGQLNEHICASAIYYYDSENITTSRLLFRQQSRTLHLGVSYMQDHHDWLEEVYGCQQDHPGVQYVGSICTPEGRLLTWPNILQHQVQPFKLADPTKPGHRKILALFLVDPNIRIISTANVPCQRRDWWSGVVRQGDSAISALPVELQDHVFGDVEDFPISLEDAKELRLNLMEERRKFVYMHDQAFKQHEFALCEH